MFPPLKEHIFMEIKYWIDMAILMSWLNYVINKYSQRILKWNDFTKWVHLNHRYRWIILNDENEE